MAARLEQSARRPPPARSPRHGSRRPTGRTDPRPHRSRRLQLTRVWRLCKRGHEAFDGEGARLYGGRWNPPGTAVVYTSSSLALAALELFVHLRPSRAPGDLLAIPADIPTSIAVSRIRASQLASNWRGSPAPEPLADMGARWLRDGTTPVLAVPSAVIPHEENYLLNPLHRAFRAIRFGTPERFTFDPRIWKG